MQTKTILAMDLSLTCSAFALTRVNLTTGEAEVLFVSHIKTSPSKSLGYRLFQIFRHLEEIITENIIDEFVMEKGFNRFAVATQQIQRVVGVVTICVWHHYREAKIHEISPTSVKKEVSGSGKASKEDLAAALEKYVGTIHYKTNDESDAVGVSIAFAKQKGWVK